MMDLGSKYMARALELAALGEGLVSPNPLVGAVVVKDGCIVGEGFHQFALVRHAESYAVEMAGPAARGATLYCNLEPCCHHGRTPPCTDTLIEAGIGRVVVATGDPDPRVNHRGFDQLAAAGIDVSVGLMAAEASRLNEIYLKHSATGRAFIHLVSCLHQSRASIGGEGNPNAGLGSEWRPSTELQRLARRYDLLVMGDDSAAGLAIARAYVTPPRHRTPIIAGYAAPLAAVKEGLGPGGLTGVTFIVLQDLFEVDGRESLRTDRQAMSEMACRGRLALGPLLDPLMDALASERVTSALVLASSVRLEEDLDPDKITLVMHPREAATAEWFDLKGFADPPDSADCVESGGFVEVSRYPVRE